MRPGRCDRCGRLVENLVGLSDHPDLLDGDYCERCLEEHPWPMPGEQAKKLQAENAELKAEVERLRALCAEASHLIPDIMLPARMVTFKRELEAAGRGEGER